MSQPGIGRRKTAIRTSETASRLVAHPHRKLTVHFADTDRSLQPKIQHGFSRDSYALAARQPLRGCSCRGAGQSSDGRTLAAPGDGADNRAEQTSAASKFGRALIGSEPLAAPLDEVAGLKPILAPMNPYRCETDIARGPAHHDSRMKSCTRRRAASIRRIC